MHVPLVATVVREEIVDHSIKTRPVCAVVGVCGLSSRDRYVRVSVSFNRSDPCGLVRLCKGDFHERTVIGPWSKASTTTCLFSRIWNHSIPLLEVCAPLSI